MALIPPTYSSGKWQVYLITADTLAILMNQLTTIPKTSVSNLQVIPLDMGIKIGSSYTLLVLVEIS